MRIDSFLNATNIVKKRAIAQDMCDNNVVEINGVRVKSSKEVRVGDRICLHFLEHTRCYEVLSIPTTRTTSKSMAHTFIKEL
ncbi:RNA-binding S4 domain-containing protein [uncultured Helicobacter sp.]|uniref:RNA-binding S4 domain-containing protein n=1 Tax=Helicobacter sp. TaxID=218 RepID=UPI00262A211F|nr:RNA-binding S4 domain-containing protein [uncultured Helicobacter sp.]